MVIAMLLLWNPICVSSILQVREKKTKMVNFPFFDQQVQQVFYNIQHALIAAQAQLSDIAVLRVLIVDHDSEKLQILAGIMQSLWKNHAFPVCTLIPVSRLA